MTIELAGYDMLLTNALYTTDFAKTARDQEGNEVSLGVYVLPMVYRQPTEDAVVNYLMKEAGRLEMAASLPPIVQNSVAITPVAKILMSVPQLRQDLQHGDMNLLSFVRKYTPAPALSDPCYFVKVMYGILPQAVVEKYSDTTEKEDAQWYAQALTHFRSMGLGELFTLQMTLDEQRKLPDKTVIDMLVGLGVYGSPALELNKPIYDKKLVGELLNKLYEGLEGENILTLRDVSEQELQPYALAPLEKVLEQSSRNAAAQHMAVMGQRGGNGGGQPAVKLDFGSRK